MDPFDVELREASMELDMLEGKECLACLELRMAPHARRGHRRVRFLLSLTSLRKIPLPPLLMHVARCALISSPTPPDCIAPSCSPHSTTTTCYAAGRPGDDEEWRKLPVGTDGDIVCSRGKMYVPTEIDAFVAIDASMPSSSGVAMLNGRAYPTPSTMRWRSQASLVESDGDVFLLQFYVHGFNSSEVVDMDIHLLDTSACVWNKVESIGDRTIFVGDNCVSSNTMISFDEDVEQVAAPWSSLPVDMVDELVSRLSFIDYLSVRQVCKRWSSISKPAQYSKRYPAYPVLMSICSSSAGTFKLFDPITEKGYTLKNSSLVSCDDYFQMLLFAKHGWVLVLRGSRYMYATNPFTGEMLQLPDIPCLHNQFDGISFSSAPKSPDCVVCAIDKTRNAAHNNLVMVWHAGDDQWTKLEIDYNTQFRSSYSNPVFYHDEFYCLGTRGNQGVFNPHNMTWRVLDKPGAIIDGDPMPGDQYCHLVEFRDNLIAIFRPHEDGPMYLYRLDMSQMVWTKVERLDNEVVFVDNWNAVMVPAPRDDTSCNRIYISKVGGYNEEGEPNRSAFYMI
ncbi:unnamed protein product [Urochloa decumbens]|uniref:F-box domain-containing protein n=1 Tax=Urochloa decumbens TaxID=240449 RepID=A0ABC9CGZ6_9POAL